MKGRTWEENLHLFIKDSKFCRNVSKKVIGPYSLMNINRDFLGPSRQESLFYTYRWNPFEEKKFLNSYPSLHTTSTGLANQHYQSTALFCRDRSKGQKDCKHLPSTQTMRSSVSGKWKIPPKEIWIGTLMQEYLMWGPQTLFKKAKNPILPTTHIVYFVNLCALFWESYSFHQILKWSLKVSNHQCNTLLISQ